MSAVLPSPHRSMAWEEKVEIQQKEPKVTEKKQLVDWAVEATLRDPVTAAAFAAALAASLGEATRQTAAAMVAAAARTAALATAPGAAPEEARVRTLA